MCGPADFDALHTCICRLAEISAAGLTSCAAYRAVSVCREPRAKRDEQEERPLPGMPGQPAVEGASGLRNP